MSVHHRIDYFELPASDLQLPSAFIPRRSTGTSAITDLAMRALATQAASAKPEAFLATRITLVLPWRYFTATTWN
jgi:hypothetical protein